MCELGYSVFVTTLLNQSSRIYKTKRRKTTLDSPISVGHTNFLVKVELKWGPRPQVFP